MIPADLVTDLDLLAIDVQAEAEFGNSPLGEKRRIAVTQWLRPRLEAHGLPPARHVTRREPEQAWSVTGGVFTDQRDAFSSRVDSETNLGGILLTPATDCLYLGMEMPFRGMFVAMADTVNAVACVSSLSYWNGKWSALSSLADGTVAVVGKTFSGGGRVTWELPDDWLTRTINGAVAHYIRVQVSTPLSPQTLVSQIAPLGFSRLTNPCALYALGLLYRESIGSNRGAEAYAEKAKMFFAAADAELQLALPLCADEFDVDASGEVAGDEAQSLVNTDGLTTWERG